MHDPEDAEGANAEEGNDHGFDGVTETAERAADNVHDTAEEVCGEQNLQTEPPPLDDIGIGVVNTEELFAEKEDDASDDDTGGNGAYNAVKDAADDALVLFCAVVLTGETDGGVKKRRHGNVNETFETLRGGISGDGKRCLGIHSRLCYRYQDRLHKGC